MLIIRKILFLLPISLSALFAGGQDKEVKAQLGRDSIMIGEQISYSLDVIVDQDVNAIPPPEEKIFPGGIEVLEQYIDTMNIDDISHIRFHYLITGFDSGIFELPGAPVILSNESFSDTVYFNPLVLNIYMPAVDTTAEIRDIKAPINTPLTIRELTPWILLGAGGLIVLFIGIFMYQILTGKKKFSLKTEPTIPAHEKALERLYQIKKEKIWQQGKVKEYYVMLSNTIRIYLEERYNIDAMEMISSEILEKFRKYAQDDSLLLEMLESLLNLSDMVKFAKEDPAPVENETNLNNAFIFVEKTKPVEIVNEKNQISTNNPDN